MFTEYDETQKQIQRLLGRAYSYLGLRSRTKKEMETYLAQKAEIYSYGPEIIQAFIDHLIEQGYLNDRKFIDIYVLARQGIKQKGTSVLKNELLQKGIERELIDQYFDENPQNEDVLAAKLFHKIISRYSSNTPLERNKKIYNYLSRRGFSYDTIRKTIEELGKKG